MPLPAVEGLKEAADGGVVLADPVVEAPEDPAEIGAKMKDPLEALCSGRIQSDDQLSLGQESVRAVSYEDDDLARQLLAEVRHSQQLTAGIKDDLEVGVGLFLEEGRELLGNLHVRDNHEDDLRWARPPTALPRGDGLECLFEGLRCVPREGHGGAYFVQAHSGVLDSVKGTVQVVVGLEGVEVVEDLLPECWRGQCKV